MRLFGFGFEIKEIVMTNPLHKEFGVCVEISKKKNGMHRLNSIIGRR